MEEENFSQQNISNIVRNILTLRYDPTQKTELPKLSSADFLPTRKFEIDYVEKCLITSIEQKIGNAKNVSIALSGGVDSTLVLGLIRKSFPNLPINAISIKFDKSVDETQNAKKIAEYFEADHEIISLENYLLELPKAIKIIGLPFWDIHWYYIAKNASKKSNLLASGDGGDELFGGYTFRYSKFLSLVNSSSTILEKIQAYLSCHERDWVPDQEKIFHENIKFSWKSINSIFHSFFDNSIPLLNQVFLADYNGKLLYNFSKIGNKINHFFNINAVTPILEPELISYTTHLPPESKYNSQDSIGKLPLRQLLKKYNWDSLVSNEKLGFSVNTVNLWNSVGKEICKTYLDKGQIVEDKIINKEWINAHIDKNDLDIKYVNKFLGLLALEIWYRLFITKEMDSETKLL